MLVQSEVPAQEKFEGNLKVVIEAVEGKGSSQGSVV